MLFRRPTLVVALALTMMFVVGVAIGRIMMSVMSPPAGDGAPAPRRLANLPEDAPWTSARPAEPSRGTRASDGPSFDILRIDPSGVSVFAGRAEPGADVAILAGGKEIARTKADGEGNWSIVTGSIYKGGELPFRVAATKNGRTLTSEAVTLAVPVTPAVKEDLPARVLSGIKPKPAEPRAAAAGPEAAATRQLERLVEEVRTDPAVANNPARAPEVIPLPITFESGRTRFTPEGRRAAGLLVEYLKGAGLRAVTLSGHADERGPDRYNMRLSRKRLEAIADYLREHGYSGQLRLLAKGESEPFKGIDRAAAPREQLWRVDRRVELRTR